MTAVPMRLPWSCDGCGCSGEVHCLSSHFVDELTDMVEEAHAIASIRDPCGATPRRGKIRTA